MKKQLRNEENKFTQACQRMHLMANSCQNWLNIASRERLTMLHCSSGCMRSTRLAVLRPVTGEVTERSLVQLVTLPAQFDAMGRHNYERSHWQLFVYSWLGREITLKLMEHLDCQSDRSVVFFLVNGSECNRVVL